MEYRDWNGRGKESFTTPGGSFRPPVGPARSYEYERSAGAEPRSPGPGATASGQAESPFSRNGAAQPRYAGSAEARPGEGVPGAPVVLSHDGENPPAYTLEPPAPGGPNVYTLRIPAPPRQTAPKKRSLWWVVPVLLGALLLGVLLGVLLESLLRRDSAPGTPQSSAEPVSGETAAARIYRENTEAVLRIIAIPAEGAGEGSPQTVSAGTGFLISERGYILTNAHVVSGAASIQVSFSDGSQRQASLVAANSETGDAALLRIEGAVPKTVRLGDSDRLHVGDWVCTIGNPYGELSNSLTAGYYSAAPRQVDTGGRTLEMLQINAAVNKGNSGGPLFDEAGRVVGMVTAKLAAPGAEPAAEALEGLGFALPINAVLSWVRSVCPEALN